MAKRRRACALPAGEANEPLHECQAALERERKAHRKSQDECRLKDEFLSVLAHELRGPLNAILGWAHLLRDGRLDRETAARGLEIICKNAELQGQLITDVVDASRRVAASLRKQGGDGDVAGLAKRAVQAAAKLRSGKTGAARRPKT